MDARGLREDEVIEGARRSTLAQLADWTIEADKVLVFYESRRHGSQSWVSSRATSASRGATRTASAC
jgi:hypothetical protein